MDEIVVRRQHRSHGAGPQVLRRDGYKCVVSGAWDMWYCRLTDTGVVLPGGPGIIPVDEKPAWTDAVRIFKHPLVVYKDIYENDKVRCGPY